MSLSTRDHPAPSSPHLHCSQGDSCRNTRQAIPRLLRSVLGCLSYWGCSETLCVTPLGYSSPPLLSQPCASPGCPYSDLTPAVLSSAPADLLLLSLPQKGLTAPYKLDLSDHFYMFACPELKYVPAAVQVRVSNLQLFFFFLQMSREGSWRKRKGSVFLPAAN